MRVKRLEITGFKSFADSTVLDFSADLSAVVGPNGCGKSNVVDAIRWVLGEQSARTLRGKNMEDVIFNGSDRRAPTNLSEVSIIFENQGTISSPQFADLSEIMITRRLFRNGDSEYLINKHSCRLKDIQQLLMDTGLSNRAYAIIEQDRVAAFTQAKPEVRRLWLEEAAGITRLKNQKKVSQSKVDEALLNLKIVDNSLADLQKQMSHLSRQSKKAKIYQELREEIQTLDLKVASVELKGHNQGIEASQKQLEDNHLSNLGLEQNLTSLDLQQQNLSNKMLELEQELTQISTTRQDNHNQIARSEEKLKYLAQQLEDRQRQLVAYEQEHGQIEVKLQSLSEQLAQALYLKENAQAVQQQAYERSQQVRAELGRAKEENSLWQQKAEQARSNLSDSLFKESRARDQLADVENRLQAYSRQQTHLDSRQRMLEEELLELEGRIAGQSREMENARQRMTASEEAIKSLAGAKEEEARQLVVLRRQEQDLSRAYQQQVAEYDARQTSLGSYDWALEAVRKLLKEDNKPFNVLGVVAEKLNVAEGAETIVESALAADLQAIIVPTLEDGQKLLQWLDDKNLGRLRVVVLEALKSLSAPQGHDPLAGLVSAEAGFEALSALWSGSALMHKPSWQAGAVLQPGQVLVGPQGQRMDRPGTASLGQGNMGALLSRRNQLKQMALEVERALAAWQQMRASREQAERDLEDMENDFQYERQQHQDTEQLFRNQERELSISQIGLKQKERELETIAFELDEKQHELAALENQTRTLNEEALKQEERRAKAEKALQAASERLEATKLSLEEVQQRDIEAQVELSNLHNRLNGVLQESQRLQQEVDDSQQRLQFIEQSSSQASGGQQQLQHELAAGKAVLEANYQLAEQYEQAYLNLRQRQEEYVLEQNQLAEKLKQTSSQQRNIESLIQEINLQLNRLQMARENLCQQVEERCQVNLRQAYVDHLPQEDFDLNNAKEQLLALRQKLVRLGPVNLEAIHDFEALSEKHKDLSEQKQDVENALADMRKAVRDINQRSRSLFMSTLQEVNEKLTQVFPTLFAGGGKAVLVLQEDVDPLEAGLDIKVELPGKKVRNLEAMSGGEKALIAVAVLFAMFLIRPAPFCILDEVDAPLDEANVDRFHLLLRQLAKQSQLLLITHNRRTMEAVEMLYGVTMQERGVSKILAVTLGQDEDQSKSDESKSLVAA